MPRIYGHESVIDTMKRLGLRHENIISAEVGWNVPQEVISELQSTMPCSPRCSVRTSRDNHMQDYPDSLPSPHRVSRF